VLGNGSGEEFNADGSDNANAGGLQVTRRMVGDGGAAFSRLVWLTCSTTRGTRHELRVPDFDLHGGRVLAAGRSEPRRVGGQHREILHESRRTTALIDDLLLSTEPVWG
jgi:hypothetical protein